MPQKFPLNFREETAKESGIIIPAVNTPEIDGYIYVPSVRLYFQKERQLFNNDWKQATDGLISQRVKAPTIEEFRQFLIFLKQNPSPENTSIYNEILEVRSPYRAEWLDARFEKQGRDMIMFCHIYDDKGNIIERPEKISGTDYLNRDRTPGINLERWLEDATPQGLPKAKSEKGDFYYWKPVSGAVAGVWANSVRAFLDCFRFPSIRDVALGVRAVRRADAKTSRFAHITNLDILGGKK